MALPTKNIKGLSPKINDGAGMKLEATAETVHNNNAPKYGTVIPNRVFVGGISSSTTETDLAQLFSNYGKVVSTKIIADRAGVSKGYGFVTFDSEEEALRLQKDADNIMLRERRLNIAPAIKKQNFSGRGYDSGAGTPVTTVQQPAPIYHQNGVSYAYHNGMAFFNPTCPTQPPPLPQIQSAPVDPAIYSSGYGNPGPHVAAAYTPPMLYPAQLYYQSAQFPQYQVPYEGCYDGQGVMIQTANPGGGGGGGDAGPMVVQSTPAPHQYYIGQGQGHVYYATGHELTYAHPYYTAQPQPPDTALHHLYHCRRQYDHLELEMSRGGGRGAGEGEGSDTGGVKPDSSTESSNNSQATIALKAKQQQLNNNNPDTTNRNLVKTPPPAPYSPMVRPFHYPPPPHPHPHLDTPRFNTHPQTNVQVPQFPFCAQNQRAFYTAQQQPLTQRRFSNTNNIHRRQNNGGGRGRARGGGSVGGRQSGGGSVTSGDSPGGGVLTPPITPRCSPQDPPPPQTSTPQDIASHAIQALSI